MDKFEFMSFYQIFFKRSDLPYDSTKDAGEKTREDYVRNLANFGTAYIDTESLDSMAIVIIPRYSRRVKKAVYDIFRELVSHACYIYSGDKGGLLWEKQSDAAYNRYLKKLYRELEAQEEETA